MRLIISVLFMSLLAAAEAVAETRIHCEGQEENLATYLEINRVLFNERDTTRVEEFYGSEIISHNDDAGGSGARTVTPDFMRKIWESSKKNDPGRVLEDELILCTADFVVVRTTMKGNNGGPVLSHPPTGKDYEITATDIYRFEDGKVVERWGNADLITLYRQLGFRMEPVSERAD